MGSCFNLCVKKMQMNHYHTTISYCIIIFYNEFYIYVDCGTYSTTRSLAQISHGYDRDRMPKKDTMSSDCFDVGLSGYVAAIVCNRFHVDRPNSSLSSGQPCLNRPFSFSGNGFAVSSVLCAHNEFKQKTKKQNTRKFQS